MNRSDKFLIASLFLAWGVAVAKMTMAPIPLTGAVAVCIMYLFLGTIVVFLCGVILSWFQTKWRGYGFVVGALIVFLFVISQDFKKASDVTPANSAKSTSEYRDVKSITQQWIDQGWSQPEVLGVPGPVNSIFHIKSDTARFLIANWVEGGEPKKKMLSQDSQKYLLLRCEKANGDSFVVIMSKEAHKKE